MSNKHGFDKTKKNSLKVMPKVPTDKLIIDDKNEDLAPAHEPFSISSLPLTQMNTPKLPKIEVLDKFARSGMVNDVSKVIDNCVTSSTCSISNIVDITKVNTDLSEKLISVFTTSMSKNLEHNIKLSQNLLKCRDAKDILDFQNKFFGSNMSLAVELCLDVSNLMQKFAFKNMQISSDYMEKNVKCFTK